MKPLSLAEIRKAREFSKELGGDVLPSEQAIDTLLSQIDTLLLQVSKLQQRISILERRI